MIQEFRPVSAPTGRLRRIVSKLGFRLWRLRGVGRLLGLLRLLAGGTAARVPVLEPMLNVGADGAGWLASSADPQFVLRFLGSVTPVGPCDLELSVVRADGRPVRATLYFDLGCGPVEGLAWHATLMPGRVLRTWLHIPLGTRSIRFDPAEAPGHFEVPCLRFVPRGAVELVVQAVVFRLRGRPGVLATWLRERLCSHWPSAALSMEPGRAGYRQYLAACEPDLEREGPRIARHIESLPLKPRFSILVPVYKTPLQWLDRMIQSVLDQRYVDWELVLVDDHSQDPVLAARLQHWSSSDPRIVVHLADQNRGIAGATNEALARAGGDFAVLLDHDDELHPLALYYLAVEVSLHPDVALIYTDEDKIDLAGERFEPHFKPDWSPELLDSQNYICHLTALRMDLLQQLGGLRADFDGAQDYDLVLRVAARLQPSRIRHIPVVLYHWRAIPGSTALAASEKSYPHEAGRRALQAQHSGAAAVEDGAFPFSYRVESPPEVWPLVTIIIPTRDGYAHLKRCVESILSLTSYPDFEILLMDNQSRDVRTLEWFTEVQDGQRIRVLLHDAPFNFSAINNHAAKQARGEVLVLLNDDTEVIGSDWLQELVAQATKPGVGAVGAKLYYPDHTVQHAGVALGLGGVAGHPHVGFPGNAMGYMGRLQVRQNVSAVTGACLAVCKSRYFEVGGLDEANLAVAFNDVDFCLKLIEAGYRNIWTPYSELFHHESKSRGRDDAPEKRERFRGEIRYMMQRWASQVDMDPFFSRHFSRIRPDFVCSEQVRPWWPWVDETAPGSAQAESVGRAS